MLKAVVELAAYGVAATLAAVCFLVWAWKWGGWSWAAVSRQLRRSALAVMVAMAVVATIEAQKRGGTTVTTGVPPVESGTPGTTGILPVENPTTDTLHFSAIVVTTNGTVTLTAAWPENFLAAGQTLDILVKSDLRDETWTWFTNGVVEANTTNMSWVLENQSPSNSFYKAVVRDSLTDMDDPDGDGIPNVYELVHGRNPHVSDYALFSKWTVGPSGTFTTIEDAVAASTSYSIIELDPDVRHETVGGLGVQIPQYPIMVTAPRPYAVVRSSGLAAFMLPTNTTSRTLFRNLYVLLDGSGSSQVGFWCGGNLPDAGVPASATFENIYMRMRSPATQYRGWLFYRGCADQVVLRNCTLNALGAKWAVGVEAFGSPPLEIDRCSFLNFPPDVPSGLGCGVLLRTSNASDGGSDATISRSIFDESFTNAWPLGRLDATNPYFVTFSDCLVPPSALMDYSPDVVTNLTVTNAMLTLFGVPYPTSPSVALGIGSLAPIENDPLTDTDGDMLSNYAEAYVRGTDPFLSDTDGDGISDAVEVLEQTEPVDGLNFCFTCTASVSNVDAVYTNGCCSYLVGQEISTPVKSFVGSATVELPHVTVTDGVVPRVVAWIDVNANGMWEVGEPRAIRTLAVTNHALAVSIDLLQTNGDMDGDKMPDVWEVLHGFYPTNSADAFEDPDGDTLPNLFEYRYATNPHNALDGSNTVYSILARSIDDRLRAKIDAEGDVRHIYVDYADSVYSGGAFVLNTNAWTHGLDFSPVGVKSVRSGTLYHGVYPILISDRHVIEARHCHPATNDVIWFRAPDGALHERTIVGIKKCQDPNNDVTIGRLNAPLPPTIVPVRFLPENFRLYIWDGERLPTIRLNQYSQAVVQEIARIPPFNALPGDVTTTVPEVQYRFSDDMIREAFFTDVKVRDSGHPNFLVADGALIFLFATHNTPDWHFGMSCLSICLKNEIEMMMNALCEESSITNRYQIEEFNFQSLENP